MSDRDKLIELARRVVERGSPRSEYSDSRGDYSECPCCLSTAGRNKSGKFGEVLHDDDCPVPYAEDILSEVSEVTPVDD